MSSDSSPYPRNRIAWYCARIVVCTLTGYAFSSPEARLGGLLCGMVVGVFTAIAADARRQGWVQEIATSAALAGAIYGVVGAFYLGLFQHFYDLITRIVVGFIQGVMIGFMVGASGSVPTIVLRWLRI